MSATLGAAASSFVTAGRKSLLEELKSRGLNIDVGAEFYFIAKMLYVDDLPEGVSIDVWPAPEIYSRSSPKFDKVSIKDATDEVILEFYRTWYFCYRVNGSPVISPNLGKYASPKDFFDNEVGNIELIQRYASSLVKDKESSIDSEEYDPESFMDHIYFLKKKINTGDNDIYSLAVWGDKLKITIGRYTDIQATIKNEAGADQEITILNPDDLKKVCDLCGIKTRLEVEEIKTKLNSDLNDEIAKNKLQKQLQKQLEIEKAQRNKEEKNLIQQKIHDLVSSVCNPQDVESVLKTHGVEFRPTIYRRNEPRRSSEVSEFQFTIGNRGDNFIKFSSITNKGENKVSYSVQFYRKRGDAPFYCKRFSGAEGPSSAQRFLEEEYDFVSAKLFLEDNYLSSSELNELYEDLSSKIKWYNKSVLAPLRSTDKSVDPLSGDSSYSSSPAARFSLSSGGKQGEIRDTTPISDSLDRLPATMGSSRRGGMHRISPSGGGAISPPSSSLQRAALSIVGGAGAPFGRPFDGINAFAGSAPQTPTATTLSSASKSIVPTRGGVGSTSRYTTTRPWQKPPE